MLGGIQVNEDDHQRWMAALHQAGMNAVQVTIYAQQGAWHSANLWYEESAPAVHQEIQVARRNGLQTTLILRVNLDHGEPDNHFLWHGLIFPKSEQELAAWFDRYTSFVLKWAQVAEKEGVEILGIGSELKSLTATLPVDELPSLVAYYLDEKKQKELRALVQSQQHRFTEEVRLAMDAVDVVSFDALLKKRNRAERAWAKSYTFSHHPRPIGAMNRRRGLLNEYWRQLIAKVRQVYSGRLILAANFDNYDQVAFWDALDLIGINAYFSLRISPSRPLTSGALEKSWREIFTQIDGFRTQQHLRQKVIFTELGYSRYEGATVAPWGAHGFVQVWDPLEPERLLIWSEQPIVPHERALAVRALHAARSPSLAGLFYWKLSSRIAFERLEPFMLHLGLDAESEDPLLDALRLFSNASPPRCTSVAPDEPTVLTCARLDQVSVMQKLLKARTALDVTDARGRSALHLAADQASKTMVELLLANGAKVHAVDGDRLTPLHLAAQRGLPRIITPLVRASSAQKLDRGGNSPLSYAAYYGKAEAFRLLWNRRIARRKNKDQQTLLHLAACGGDQKILSRLLQDVQLRQKIDGRDRKGRTPLHEAVLHGQTEATKILLRHGARVDRVDSSGLGILHSAATAKQPQILPLLLARKPSLDIADREGHTPLHHAAGWGRLENTRRLVAAGASMEVQNNAGQTPLELAEKSGRQRVVQLLRSLNQNGQHRRKL